MMPVLLATTIEVPDSRNGAVKSTTASLSALILSEVRTMSNFLPISSAISPFHLPFSTQINQNMLLNQTLAKFCHLWPWPPSWWSDEWKQWKIIFLTHHQIAPLRILNSNKIKLKLQIFSHLCKKINTESWTTLPLLHCLLIRTVAGSESMKCIALRWFCLQPRQNLFILRSNFVWQLQYLLWSLAIIKTLAFFTFLERFFQSREICVALCLIFSYLVLTPVLHLIPRSTLHFPVTWSGLATWMKGGSSTSCCSR